MKLFSDRTSYRCLLWGTAAALCLLTLLAFCIGRYWVPPLEVLKALFSWLLPVSVKDPNGINVVISLRLPRVFAALLIGAALSLSGASYQAVFRNPLVAPDLLGVSSGACAGASLAILFDAPMSVVQTAAFAGGLAAVALTLSIPRRLHRNEATMLLLGGIIVAGVLNSLIGLIKYLANPETHLVEITYWQLGSISRILPKDVSSTAPVIIIAGAVLMVLRWRISILSLGENEARMLGVPVRQIRLAVIICATLLTACSVCIGGTIGWVGLVIPHLGRLITGPDNARLFPVTAMLGGGFLLFVDTIARSLSGAELPLSILTGLIGASVFFYLLCRSRSQFQRL